MKLPVVFLCGDRSPYGLAHLDAIAKHFDLKALILADDVRWNYFRSVLSGGGKYEYQKPVVRWIKKLKLFVRQPLVFMRERLHKNRLSKLGVPIYVFNDANSAEALRTIKSLKPIVLISAAYPQIFKKPLLEVAPRGAINFHPSLLPRCRGAHPHYWCLATGEQLGGVTAHYMTERIDDGDIIAQRSFELEGLYYPDLYRKIIAETPPLISTVAEFLNDKNATPIPQDERSVTFFRNDREIHHRLDFLQMTANQLYNRIRAGNAYCLFRGRRVNMIHARIATENRHVINGAVVSCGIITDIDSSGIWVSVNDGLFLVISYLSSTGRPLQFYKWIATNDVLIGERFE